MRRTRLALVLLTALGVSCGDDEPDPVVPRPVESQGWTVTALTPTLTAAGQVEATMLLERASGAATRGGGLCLVADLGGGLRCQDAADCAPVSLPAGGFHYCAGVNGGSSKTCWTRPGAGELYCNRSPSRQPGSFTTPAVEPLVDGRATTWMAYACLANEDNPAGCGSSDPAQYVVATSPTLQIAP